ncbi:unnamed protein product [Penicillium egyptiacum]|uniref:Letm1 RBD domain-containing protein n=1 Tax=Penicillium egyptiacum TaxID=1303716 RepID=A0A9W4KM60_9EURO|nr:unnamed protein product [Penicillium egyptiacum]
MAGITRVQRALHFQFQPWNHYPFHAHLRSKLLPICAQSLFSTSAPSQQSRGHSPSPSPTTTAVSTPSKTEINAPISTHPAAITTPSPLPSSAGATGKLRRYVEFGRAYVTFYKTGLKNVYRNYRASLPLRRKLGLPAYIPISPPRTRALNPNNGSAPSLAPKSKLGRAQFQLVRRSARDVRRMIPFTMILIVCGEFTPLIIPIFGSAITPATCRVPSQVEKERVAATARKLAALHVFVAENKDRSMHLLKAGDAEQLALLARSFADPVWVASAGSADVLRACAVFGLVKRHDRTAGESLAGLIYRPRLARYVEYLAIDDGMIRVGGGVSAMNATEVRIAAEERGGVDVSSGTQDRKRVEELERRWLEQWLSVRGDSPRSKK